MERESDSDSQGYRPYFDAAHDVEVVDAGSLSHTLRAYYGAACASASPESESESESAAAAAAARTKLNSEPSEPALLFLLIHGAGLCALSWALSARLIRNAGHHVVAADLRAHGHSHGADEESLTLDAAVADVCAVYARLTTHEHPCLAGANVVVVGHSFGGSVAARIVSQNRIDKVTAVALIDAVEGTALESLDAMPRVLEARPASFSSPQEGVEWALSSGMLRRRDSARASVPPTLTRQPRASESLCDSKGCESAWRFRTALARTARHWRGWFESLGADFDGCAARGVPRLLIVGGATPLDRAQTIAHMQGKLQHVQLNEAGHIVHEDEPQRVARALVEFGVRAQRAHARLARLRQKT